MTNFSAQSMLIGMCRIEKIIMLFVMRAIGQQYCHGGFVSGLGVHKWLLYCPFSNSEGNVLLKCFDRHSAGASGFGRV